jgi:hypothetical protein
MRGSQMKASGRVWVLAAVVGLFVLVPSARALINLEFRPGSQTVNVGDPGDVDLYAVSDSSADQYLAAVDLVFAWDPTYLDLFGLDYTGSPLLSAFFSFPDPLYGINEANPPADGDGLAIGFAPLGVPVAATPAGAYLFTLQFDALAETLGTPISILASLQKPSYLEKRTIVFDGTVPNLDVTGTLSGAMVTIVPEPATVLLGIVALGSMIGLQGRRVR